MIAVCLGGHKNRKRVGGVEGQAASLHRQEVRLAAGPFSASSQAPAERRNKVAAGGAAPAAEEQCARAEAPGQRNGQARSQTRPRLQHGRGYALPSHPARLSPPTLRASGSRLRAQSLSGRRREGKRRVRAPRPGGICDWVGSFLLASVFVEERARSLWNWLPPGRSGMPLLIEVFSPSPGASSSPVLPASRLPAPLGNPRPSAGRSDVVEDLLLSPDPSEMPSGRLGSARSFICL